VKYIPLDRIPVRALPRGYGPKIGITIVESRQLDTSDATFRGRKKGCIFSVACGSHTHFWAAQMPSDAKVGCIMLELRHAMAPQFTICML
jgi:hypothetical protein